MMYLETPAAPDRDQSLLRNAAEFRRKVRTDWADAQPAGRAD